MTPNIPETGAEVGAEVQWSRPLPDWRGGRLAAPDGTGCLLFGATAITAYSPDGRLMWEVSSEHTVHRPVFVPDGPVLRIENETVVARDPGTGEVVGSFRAPSAIKLAPAPWGDLLYLEPRGGLQATVHCVALDGRPRWSLPITARGSGVAAFAPVGDVVLVEQRGEVWSLDREGGTPWIADTTGLRPPGPGDHGPRPVDDPHDDVRITDLLGRPQPDQLLLEFATHSQHGLYLLDSGTPNLTPVLVPNPLLRPAAIAPDSGPRPQIVGLGGQIRVRDQEYRHTITAVDWDGNPLWERSVRVKPDSFDAVPGGYLAVASPSEKYWQAYRGFYDMTELAWLHMFGADGSTEWVWHPPGPLTGGPATAPDGTVYVACEGRLWALSGARAAGLWRPGAEAGPVGGPMTAGEYAPAPGPVTYEQAQAIADAWSSTGRAVLWEFDLGYQVFDVVPEREDPTRPPAGLGAGRGVIDKQTGGLSVWPSLPPEVVAQMYRDNR